MRILRHLSGNWAKFNAKSKQIALELICELVQRGAHLRIQDEEDHFNIVSIFDSVRKDLRESMTAWRLQKMVKKRRAGERTKVKGHSKCPLPLKQPKMRESQGPFAKLLVWMPW